MGITCASLYNAFGDKRGLFRRALEHYVGAMSERIARLEETSAPRDAIVAFLEGAIDRALADRERRGCMLVNSALELAPHDEEFRGLVCDQLGAMEAFFRRAVLAGQRDGSIGTQRPADELARHFLGVSDGPARAGPRTAGSRAAGRRDPPRSVAAGQGCCTVIDLFYRPAPNGHRIRCSWKKPAPSAASTGSARGRAPDAPMRGPSETQVKHRSVKHRRSSWTLTSTPRR